MCVCPRRVVEIVNLTPFDWVSRKVHYADLEIPSVMPLAGAGVPVVQSALPTGQPLLVRDDVPVVVVAPSSVVVQRTSSIAPSVSADSLPPLADAVPALPVFQPVLVPSPPPP